MKKLIDEFTKEAKKKTQKKKKKENPETTSSKPSASTSVTIEAALEDSSPEATGKDGWWLSRSWLSRNKNKNKNKNDMGNTMDEQQKKMAQTQDIEAALEDSSPEVTGKVGWWLIWSWLSRNK